MENFSCPLPNAMKLSATDISANFIFLRYMTYNILLITNYILDYYQVIDTPMDLGTVKEDLLGNNYKTPYDFCKDMRLIFQNSKNYNTNKRSRVRIPHEIFTPPSNCLFQIYTMTLRLAAMFEEHVTKIIYNWKVAKRRETVQNGRRSSRKLRQKYVQNGNNQSSEAGSNNSDYEIPNERVNGYTKDNHFNHQNNNRAKYVSPSSSDDEPSTSFTNHKTTKQKSDSEESYKPTKRKPKKPARKFKLEESSSSEASPSEDDVRGNDDDDDDDEEDDSDNQPLSVHARTRLRVKRRVCSESSESEGESSKMRTRQCKRPKYVEDSDSDRGSRYVKQRNGGDSGDSSEYMVTVSSRGRVRRLTARARALLKK